ncbi:MAG: M42 family metallopeptidase [Candidatus Hadarchaeales archaeon]
MMFDAKSLDFLKRLTEAFGPPGFEREASRIVEEYMKPYADGVVRDKLGSVAFLFKGDAERPRVLLAGHVDEVGFAVSGIDEKTGFLSFSTLGGWWDQVLLGQRVVVRTSRGDLLGVIASKPPHIMDREEREKLVKKDEMYIDIGVTSKEEAERLGVKIGDPVVPWSPFALIREGKVAMGKAFDDRLGTFVMLEACRRIKEQGIAHPNTIYAASTVQEEVGLRGAKTIAHVVDPDVGIVLEIDISGDVPGVDARKAAAKMGKGPTIFTMDGSMIPNQPFKEFVLKVAEECKIPLQLSQVMGGGTDAGRIHLHGSGCPTVVLGVPTRHIHSHVGLFSLEDAENGVRLLIELLRRLDQRTVESFL